MTKKIPFKINLLLGSFLISLLTLALYYYPFFKHALPQIDITTASGVLLLISLFILVIVLNTLASYLVLYIFRGAGKYIIGLSFILNAIALYFINTYNVLIDDTMIGNVFNTDYGEASSFFSWDFILYVLFLGIVPAALLFLFKPLKESFKQFLLKIAIILVFAAGFSYLNSPNWLWVDKNVPVLGSLAMPWNYIVNTFRYAGKQHKNNKEAILLPDLTIKNDQKSVVVLVIGESTRKGNFSLYGYPKETNPLLSTLPDLHVYQAESEDTYTIAGVKAMLDYKPTGEFMEPLPSYLHRNGVNVIWRTSNSGEPKLSVTQREEVGYLREFAAKDSLKADFDEVLMANIKEEILESGKAKNFIALHTSTSHGPSYFKKYPAQFSKFEPVCTGVELAEYSQEELMNAYDNTIVYTDYIIYTLIQKLTELKDYKSTVFFVSDHGESLGEKGFYMHGVPKSVAPHEQFEIPFLVWSNDTTLHFKEKEMVSQYNVFHTVMDALSLDSPIYDPEMSLIEK